ncbi:MAG: SCO family protein [Planctomycetes bacterium]|nr:SCO family protein [Planctomycetota bacterium]
MKHGPIRALLPGVLLALAACGTPGAKPARPEAVEAAPCCAPAPLLDAPSIVELAPASPPSAAEPASSVRLPDVELVDQDGRRRRLASDVVAGRVVVLEFVFTTCTTICPALAANFAKLETHLGERAGRDVALVSISVDPRNDTPARMKAFGALFGAGPGWTLLTGEKADVDVVLKALGVFTPRKEDHTPLVLVGVPAKGLWKRIDGLASPALLARAVEEFAPAASAPAKPVHEPVTEPSAPAPPAASESAAQQWFTDTELVDQDGRKVRFYSDLIRGKTVVIDCFFSECTGVCPVLSRNLRALMEVADERLGRDVQLVSITVDPKNDTPEKLKEYARTLGAKPGWSFLTGTPADLDKVLGKLGFAVKAREEHSNLILIGNDRTGLWKKAFGLAASPDVVRIFESVLKDDGHAPAPR